MTHTESVTSTLRHISKLQGIERQALQAGDEESLLVARMMRGEITRLRTGLLGASPQLIPHASQGESARKP